MMKDFFQWAGPVEDLGEEFDKIDENGGGQVVTIFALLYCLYHANQTWQQMCSFLCVRHMTILFKS